MKTKKLFNYICIVSIAFIMAGIGTVAVNAEADSSGSAGVLIDFNSKAKEDFIEYQKSGKNPFGTKKGESINLVTQNELAFYKSYDTDSGKKASNITSAVYDGWKGLDKISEISTKDNFASKHTKNNKRSLSFMKGVAVQSKASGKDDAIVYVGVDPKGRMCCWKQDLIKDTATDLVKLNSDALLDMFFRGAFSTDKLYTNNRANYEANSLISITAGDYDGDGEDHIIVAYSARVLNPGNLHRVVVLQELDQNLKIVATKTFMGKYEKSIDGDRDNMGVALSTGDYNGDEIEDLSVMTFYGLQDHKDTVFPKIYAIRGAENSKILNNPTSSATKVGRNDSKATMYGPGLASGDINGDGSDEIIIAGHNVDIRNGKNEYGNDDFSYGYKDVNIASYTASNSGDTPVVEQSNFWQREANTWTKRCIYPTSDKVWDCIGVACMAIDGKSTSEAIFVGGTLYRVNSANDDLESVYTPKFFNRSADSNGYIASVATGVFDGNQYGREQLVLTVGEKRTLKDNYDYYTVMIGGKDYQNVDKSALTAQYGAARSYYTDHVGTSKQNMYDSGAYDKDISGKGDDLDEQVNCLVIAVDTDNDGVKGYYENMWYYNSQPNVEAVLQATPRFEEIEQPAWETSYSVATSYGHSKGSSSSNSWNLGLSVNASFPIVPGALKFNIGGENGYVAETTKSFVESLSNSCSNTFAAAERNMVIVKRTPVYTFRYRLTSDKIQQKPVNGKSYLDYTVLQDPVYFQLSVDEYNKLVDEYNAKATNKLKKLNETYLQGNEGDPTKYKNSFAGGFKLSKATIQMGYNGGHGYSAWEVEKGHESEILKSEGIHLAGSVGFTLGDDFITGAVYGGYDYTTENSLSTSSSITKTTSGSVNDIDLKSLKESKKYSEETIKAYGFDWQFGEYRVQLNADGSTTPVLGYALNNVKRPAKAPRDVEATATGNHKVKLTWTSGGANDNKGYNIYQVEKDEYTKINDEVVTDTNYTASGLDSGTCYTYVVTAVTKSSNPEVDGVDSIWSEEASAKTTDVDYTFSGTAHHGSMKVAIDGGESQTYRYGGYVLDERSVLELGFAADKGFVLAYLEVQKEGKEPYKIQLAGAEDRAQIILDANTKIVLHTNMTVTKSQFQFGVIAGSDGDEHGSVAASVNGVEIDEPGGEVTGNSVKLKAKPDEGYVLKEWNIKEQSEDGTKVVPAIGETELDYYFAASECSVHAVFADETDPSISVRLTPNINNGSIKVTDQTGKAYKPNKDGNIYVLKGRVITLTPDPDKYYLFSKWSEDLSDHENDETVTVLADKDMKIGAEFYPPILYRLTYSDDLDNGNMTVTYKDSGKKAIAGTSGYIPGISLKAHIKANHGYRIKALVIQKGNMWTNIDMDPGTTDYDYIFDMTSHTYIYPTFEPTYEVTVLDSAADDKKTGAGIYDIGQQVTLNAGSKKDHIFVGWELLKGDVVLENFGTDNTSFVIGNSDVQVRALWKKHEHMYEHMWSFDKTYHWHKAACGHDVVGDKAKHTVGAWIIDKKATKKTKGHRHKECKVCGYVMAEENIYK